MSSMKAAVVKKIIRYGRERGLLSLAVKLRERAGYKLAALRYVKDNALTQEEIEKQKNTVYDRDTLISICVPLYNTKREYLEEMLKSVIGQTYPCWELCIADGSTAEYTYIEAMIKGIGDRRIKYKKLNGNKGIVENSNEACAMASGEYIALLDHDDVLAADALYHVKKEIDNGSDYIYTDEASFSRSVKDPDIIHFKPDYSVFDLRGNNYICHLSVFKKTLFEAVGGFRQGYDGSQDHDLILRLCERAKKITHIPKVLYFWRIHPDSVAMDISAKPYCLTTGIRAVESHLERMKIKAEVTNAAENASVYRVRYKTCVKPAVINNIENIKGVENEYIIVADRNITVGAEALREMCGILQLEGVGMVGGMVIQKGRIKYATLKIRNKKTISEYEGMPSVSEGYMKRLKYAQAAEALPCKFFGIRRSVLEGMGYFDESLWEDDKTVDMCRRLKKYGYEIVFDPYAVGEIRR